MPPGIEIAAEVGRQLGMVFQHDAQLFYLRQRPPIHVGRTEVELLLVKEPELLVHDPGAIPRFHLYRTHEKGIGVF